MKRFAIAKVSKSGKVGKFVLPVLTEHQEAVAFMGWCNLHPIAKNIFATQTGVRTSIRTAVKAKKEGMKAGIPDYFLDEPRGVWHGLRIELKRTKGGVLSTDQKLWRDYYNERNYCWRLCKGADEAIATIKEYLSVGNSA